MVVLSVLRSRLHPTGRHPERTRERILAAALGVAQVRERQARGLLRADLDAGHFLLAMVALTTFPAAFPQFTRLLTGLKPTDPAFVAQHGAFLRRLAGALRPQTRTATLEAGS